MKWVQVLRLIHQLLNLQKMIQTFHKCVECKYKNSTTNMSISRLKKKKKKNNKSMNWTWRGRILDKYYNRKDMINPKGENSSEFVDNFGTKAAYQLKPSIKLTILLNSKEKRFWWKNIIQDCKIFIEFLDFYRLIFLLRTQPAN